MKKKLIVLGCGRIGATVVRDLAADPNFEVTAADLSAENLRKLRAVPRVTTRQVDLTDPGRLRAMVQEYNIVIGALPGCLGFQTVKTVIEAGKPICDISFMPEDAMELDALAKNKGVTAVVDIGVSPGLSNLIVGHVLGELDRTESALIYAGGLPKVRHWPYEYKAPFAPADVIEVYTRPARMVQNGKIVEKPALSDPELIDFPRVGTLEAFNTDGLRTLLMTVDIPNMREKTLRYSGHCELMRVLRETGFFDNSEIDVKGAKVRPLDVTSKLLFTKWALDEGEDEFTIVRVVVEGRKGDGNVRYTYDLYDEYDGATGTSSMARTTAFPCTIMARLLALDISRIAKRFRTGSARAECQGRARDELAEPGVFPPELLARRHVASAPGGGRLFDHMLQELRVRGVILTERIDEE